MRQQQSFKPAKEVTGWAASAGSIGRFMRLPWVEKRLFLLAVIMLPLTTVGMHFLGFNGWYAFLSRTASKVSWQLPDQDKHAQLRLLRRILRWAARYAPLNNYCLAQSLTLWWLLRCHGIQGDLCIGVRLVDDNLEAHAWVEYEGIQINENVQVRDRFTAFSRPIMAVGNSVVQSASNDLEVQP